MILSGFAGRIVHHVEHKDGSVKVVFEDGGYLYVRARESHPGVGLKITCGRTRCLRPQCLKCRGIEGAPSD